MKKKIVADVFILTMILLLSITVYAGKNDSTVVANIIKNLVLNNNFIEGDRNIIYWIYSSWLR